MTKTPLPESAKFFLADDIRLESDGKPSLLGFYADNIIVLQLPQDHPEPSEEHGIVLDVIAIYATFPSAQGTFTTSIQIIDPNGKVLLDSGAGELSADINGTLVFVAKFRSLVVRGFGTFRYVMNLDGRAYEFKFEIRRGTPAENESVRRFSPAEPTAKKRQRKAKEGE